MIKYKINSKEEYERIMIDNYRYRYRPEEKPTSYPCIVVALECGAHVNLS